MAWEVIEGHCIQRMKALPSNSVDVVLTDPPYSSGTRREGAKGIRKSMNREVADEEWFGSDSLTTNGFIWLMHCCAVEWFRLMRPGAHALVFIDWRMMPALAGAIESADLRHTGMLVWDKTHFGMGSHFRNQHELILHFTKGVGNPPQRRDVGNVLSCAPIRNGSHPTEKPVPLLVHLLSVVAPPDAMVLDCFAGSGATGVAATSLERSFIGIERERQYVEMAQGRIRAAEAQPQLRAS